MSLQSRIQAELNATRSSPDGLLHRAKTWCNGFSITSAAESPLCVTVAVFVLCVLVMVVLRPPLCLRNPDRFGNPGGVSMTSVVFVSALAAAAVPCVCYAVKP